MIPHTPIVTIVKLRAADLLHTNCLRGEFLRCYQESLILVSASKNGFCRGISINYQDTVSKTKKRKEERKKKRRKGERKKKRRKRKKKEKKKEKRKQEKKRRKDTVQLSPFVSEHPPQQKDRRASHIDFNAVKIA